MEAMTTVALRQLVDIILNSSNRTFFFNVRVYQRVGI